MGIERVEPYIAVIMIALALFIFYRVFSAFSISDLNSIPPGGGGGITGAVALDVVVATAISWTVLSADFNRNAKTQRGGIAGTVIGYTASTVLAMSLGASAIAYAIAAGANAPVFDPTLLVANFGLPAALVVFLSVMATNTLVVYGMVMSYLNIRPQSGFLKPALIIGLISIVGALWQGILDRFLDFLFLIGTFFVPVFAIMLADYFILRRGRYVVEDVLARRGGAYWYTGGFNAAAWVSYVVGAGLRFTGPRSAPSPSALLSRSLS
jgi:purine-cytosine permease-like protein